MDNGIFSKDLGASVLIKHWFYSLINHFGLGLLLLSFSTFLFAKTEDKTSVLHAKQNLPIPPITAKENLNPKKIQLGELLFNEVKFSQSFTHSCATCHNLKKGGTDKQTHFVGSNAVEGTLNTPTVFNSRYNFRQFWDGRAKTLKDVINDHLLDKHIYNNNWESLIERLQSSTKYNELFKSIYHENIQQSHIEEVLEQYLHTLITPNSPFDRYVRGDTKAISEDAQKGYELFNNYGCISCHQGPNVGGNLYQKMGIYKNYFDKKDKINESDLGRFNVTNRDEDTFVFKVPSLRNVALTGPYLHDGSAETLEEVVQIMAEYQVGQKLPAYEISHIVKFLETLTGDQPVNHN